MMFYRTLLLMIALSCVSQSGGAAVTDPAAFFATPAMVSAKLSPDGKHVAAIVNKHDGQRLVLLDPNTGVERTLLSLSEFTPRDASIRAITWIDGKHIAAQFFELKKGIRDLLDTRKASYLLIVRLPESEAGGARVLSVRTRGWLVDPLPAEEGAFLYAKSSVYSKVYKLHASQLSEHGQKFSKLIKIDGGQFTKANEVASIDGFATRWFVDSAGALKAVLSYTKDDQFALSAIDREGHVKALKSWLLKELAGEENSREAGTFKRIMPVAMADVENTFYCLDFAEEDERSVYKVNFATGKEELVYESASFKIIDLLLSPHNNTLTGVKVLREGEVQNIYLNDAGSEWLSDARRPRSGRLLSRVGESLDGAVSLSYTEGHSQPGRYLFRNEKTGAEKFIGSVFPHLVDRLRSRLVEGHVAVEGLDIPYLLTLPERKIRAGYPLIVLPHGGPIGVFDHRYFDLITQFLTANGYAVLRVNFRGSSGYSKELKEAGKRQWGKLMLTDIHRAALQVTARKDIDAERVCAMGMSYGGYAATMLTIRHPELYRCGINMAGVSDINLHLNAPDRTAEQDAWLKEYVGDTVAEYDALKLISPVYLVEQLQRPLLIVHGAKDEVVDVEHAYRLKRMLEKYKKPFSWHIAPNGKHSFGSSGESAEIFAAVQQFLADQL